MVGFSLRDFGFYTAGGRIAEVTEGAPRQVSFTQAATYPYDPRGHFAIEHAYVQYFIPERRNAEPPVVLVHGGGMSGSCWETTPDGRPGWLHHLLELGFETHVVDAVERGRAGFAPGHWQGEPLLRSMEEAWTLFRIGPESGFATRTPFPGQKFPVQHFDAFARIFVPRWLGTTNLQSNALLAVLERTGPAIVICHSQGGEVTFDAYQTQPANFDRIIALEPSGYPTKFEALGDLPLSIIIGDYLDVDSIWQKMVADWTELTKAPFVSVIGADQLGQGHSHMTMMDEGSKDVLLRAISN
ncbi:MAG: alpha/beta fold hydrolase [Pseudomonadota bacterium]